MLKKIESLLPKALRADRHAIRREIIRIKKSGIKFASEDTVKNKRVRLEKRLQTSIKKKSWRKANRPKPIYNDALPIFSKKDHVLRPDAASTARSAALSREGSLQPLSPNVLPKNSEKNWASPWGIKSDSKIKPVPMHLLKS